MNTPRPVFLILFALLISRTPLVARSLPGPDTLRMTLPEVQKKFLEKNLLLLAAHCQVSAAQAQVIQARAFNNPQLSLEQGLYNSQNGKWLDLSPGGETALELDQLLHLAGQRHKAVILAGIGTGLQEDQLYDLLRNLEYELSTDFFDLYFIRREDAVYQLEIASLHQLVADYGQSVNSGYVSKADLMRLEAQLLSLQSEELPLLRLETEKEADLQLLTGTDSLFILPEYSTDSLKLLEPAGQMGALWKSALENRPDLRAAEQRVEWEQANVLLQQAMAVPDMSLGIRYDRAGSYIPNYNAVTLSFDLPFFNRNRGNIMSAKDMLQASKLQYQFTTDSLQEELKVAVQESADLENRMKETQATFLPDYQKLIASALESFHSRQIGLLAFLDYYDSYKETLIHYNELQDLRLDARARLNYVAGKAIISY